MSATFIVGVTQRLGKYALHVAHPGPDQILFLRPKPPTTVRVRCERLGTSESKTTSLSHGYTPDLSAGPQYRTTLPQVDCSP